MQEAVLKRDLQIVELSSEVQVVSSYLLSIQLLMRPAFLLHGIMICTSLKCILPQGFTETHLAFEMYLATSCHLLRHPQLKHGVQLLPVAPIPAIRSSQRRPDPQRRRVST